MRIAHLSDLHLLALAGIPLQRFFNKRLSGYANLRLRRGHVHRPAYTRALLHSLTQASVDHVVITGDLTNLALEEEFAKVHALLTDLLPLPATEVTLVPGNHDVYTSGSSRAQRFARTFSNYLESDLPEYAVQVAAGRFPLVKLRGPCAFLALSSAVPRSPLRSAGYLGIEQLNALTRLLDDPRVQGRFPVVLLHHPPQNPASPLRSWLDGLDDAVALQRVLQRFSTGLVLHGHLHRTQSRWIPTPAGALYACGVTSASLHHQDTTRMASFHVYEIHEQGTLLSAESYRLSPYESTCIVTPLVPTLSTP